MSYVDIQFVNTISSSLGKFSKKKKGLYNFRCPYCGDSQKHKNKARGYLFEIKNDLVYKCHNCGVGRSFSVFLKEQFPHVYDEYVMEKYKQGLTGKGRNTPNPKVKFDAPTFDIKHKVDLERISDLNNSHQARAYLLGRGIPEQRLSDLYYCPAFKAWTNSKKKVFEDTKNDDERIIIPLFDFDGNLFGYQGRSMDIRNKMRYITVMLDDTAQKVYGLDKINRDQTVYVTEGPFDSMFLPNSVAMCGADVDLTVFNLDLVYVYDNEPRNKQIVDRIDKTIEAGYKVVIWPKDLGEKDLNDLVNTGVNVRSMVESNVYQGLEAKLQLSNWKV
jgi:predicted RNA-binding Zn-ribbon protein involved in translation (DUF1610 family)